MLQGVYTVPKISQIKIMNKYYWLLIVFKLHFNWCFAVCCDRTHLLHARLSLHSKSENLAQLRICFTDRAAHYQRK